MTNRKKMCTTKRTKNTFNNKYSVLAQLSNIEEKMSDIETQLEATEKALQPTEPTIESDDESNDDDNDSKRGPQQESFEITKSCRMQWLLDYA